MAALALAVPFCTADAHLADGLRGAEELPTRFERFVLSGCSPCVTESHPVATLPTAPLKLPGFPRLGASQTARPGEIRIDALRAYQLGRRSRQSLAVRVTLAVAAGVGGEFYRLAVGVLDEEDVPAFESAVSEIAHLAASAAPEAGAESTDTSFRGGSLRIGLIRFRSESVAYVQAGDVPTLALRPVWEVPTTIYLPPDQLPALASAIRQLAARIRQLRSS